MLIGNLDRSILNYMLYMAEIIERVEWEESDDVKIFFAIIYPYCDVIFNKKYFFPLNICQII